ncbi:radical SAM protein [Desulfosarcina sp.]|uniref:radical SAM protein n=1 Tax=Desulfosarcina sp. TaxID=2027861 RepID=UPI0029B2023E|nr:radical SAM protein [Desulfosarcina sp.]MDX2451787.1 radical SAM protein [Desulfosarcina sp.]MDX2489571.1 radical SAM protein [Desulfosarcina sp.]
MALPDPEYLKALKSRTLEHRVKKAIAVLDCCTLCPRRCGVNRTAGETGTCKTGRRAVVASYNAHFGEERPLVGRNGSGTIFFSHCSLQCNFCQNYEISHLGEGCAVADDQLATIMLELQQAGCHNINLVTPSHVVPQILKAVYLAAQQGLSVPLVYNCSGYDRVETLQLLDGIVDIYMPDFKFWYADVARDTCNAPDYPELARHALLEMHRQVGDLVIDKVSGLAYKGILVRHLVLPGGLAGTAKIMAFLANSLSRNTYVNVMSQYRPCGRAREMPALAVTLSPAEYNQAVREAKAAGITRLDKPRRLFQW